MYARSCGFENPDMGTINYSLDAGRTYRTAKWYQNFQKAFKAAAAAAYDPKTRLHNTRLTGAELLKILEKC